MSDRNHDAGPAGDDPGDADAAAPTGPTRPSPFMRFLVVVFGVILFGTGQSIAAVGGFGPILLGVLIMGMGIAVVGIAIGLVELVAGRLRARRGDPPD